MAVMEDAVIELLLIVAEESGEVVQAAGKCGRHGLDSNFAGGPFNRQDLAKELGQVQALTKMLIEAGIISPFEVDRAEQAKYANIQPYLHAPRNRDIARKLAAKRGA